METNKKQGIRLTGDHSDISNLNRPIHSLSHTTTPTDVHLHTRRALKTRSIVFGQAKYMRLELMSP
jgi:hypothetical protein